MKNSRGFSLTEALAALAISTVVGAAMWSLIQNAMSSSNQFVDKQELDELVRQSQYILMREQTCATALRSNNGTPNGGPATFDGTVGNIYALVGQNTTVAVPEDALLVQTGQNFGRIRVGSLTLRKAINDATATTELVYRRGDAAATRLETYLVNLEMIATNRAGQPLPPRVLPLKIYVNPTTRQIDNCFVTHADNQTCASFGGSFNANRGTCDMGPCDQPTAAAAGTDCPPPNGTCNTPVYFWSFRTLPGPPPTSQSVCVCARSCVPGPAPGPAPGPTPRY